MINRPKELIGLSQQEYELAKQENLLNKDVQEKDRSIAGIFRKNFLTFFNLINLIIAALLIIARSYRNLLFLIVVVSNTLIGTVQEIRAKRIRTKLSLLSKNKVRCLRDGKEELLSPDEVALYDLLILRRGDQIPADCEVEQGHGAVDESLITGESDQIQKTKGQTLLGGSFVTEGVLYSRVIAVGESCYIKKLQLEVRKDIRPKSQLLEQVNTIIKFSTVIIVPVGLLLYYKTISSNSSFYQTMPQVAAALIGMIPSGLVLLTSVALAIGVMNLAKQQVLVNELNAIENLARIDTLCLDKTGTITSGKMRLNQLFALQDEKALALEKIKLFLSNKAEENDTLLAIREGLHHTDTIEVEDTHSIAFSSDRKWSSAFVDEVHYVLGAPSFMSTDERIIRESDALAARGLRVLLFAQTTDHLDKTTDIKGLSLYPVAFVILSDCIREDMNEIISYFYKQDVSVKVISGDNVNTVRAIAESVGVANAASAMDNKDINEDTEVEKYNVYGRVSPYNKQLLVRKLKEKGHSVAMTGDGINDLPAMKISNCSVSMGSGNEATKNLSQIVLLNNNFSVMPSIVDEGRRIINNISLSASLFLNKTLFSVLLSMICTILSLPYPFQPIQLTLLSTLTIGMPSFLLTFEANKSRVKGDFLVNVLKNSLPTGLTVALMVTLALLFSEKMQLPRTESSTLISYLTTILLTASLLRICWPFNRYRLMVICGVIASLINAIAFIKQVFYFVPLSTSAVQLLLMLSIAGLLLLLLLYIVIGKYLDRKDKK